MKKIKTTHKGIALLIVLGMLSLLLIVAVAFSTLMRQGRMGASNESNAKSARHMVHAAFARAIDAINEKNYPLPNNPNSWSTNNWVSNPTHWSDKWIVHDFGNQRPANNVVMAPADILVSVDKENTQNKARLARIMHPAMENHLTAPIVRRVMQDHASASNVNSTVCAPEWCPIKDGNNPSTSSIIGRYSYIIINTSGMLDAMFSGGLPANQRKFGQSPKEIQLDVLPDNGGGVSPSTIQSYGRLDSIADLLSISAVDPLYSFRTISRSLPDMRLPVKGKKANGTNIPNPNPINNGEKIYIGSLNDIRTKKAAIKDAFKETICTDALVKNYDLGTNDDELAKRIYCALADFVSDEEGGYALPECYDLNNDAQRYQRPTVKTIYLPYRIGVYAFATQEEKITIPNPTPLNPTPTPVTETIIRVYYQFFTHNSNPYQNRNGVTPTPPASMTAEMEIKSPRVPALFAGAQLEVHSADNFKLPETMKAGEMNWKLNGSDYWLEKIETYSGQPLSGVQQIQLEYTIPFKIDIMNGAYILAQRPASITGGNRDFFHVNINFEINPSTLPCDTNLLLSSGAPWNKTQIDAPKESGGIPGNLILGIPSKPAINVIKRTFWAEPLDPRVAWQKEHWIPSHKNTSSTLTIDNLTIYSFLKQIDPAKYTKQEDIENNILAVHAVGLIMWETLNDPLLAGARIVQQNQVDNQSNRHSDLQMDGLFTNNIVDTYNQIVRTYVKNGPLESVGELAFLQLAPYYFIQLYDPKHVISGTRFAPEHEPSWWNNTGNKPRYHRVLDYFTIENQNTSVRGKVNLASTYCFYNNNGKIESAPALASVFAGMPVCFDMTKPIKYDVPAHKSVTRDPANTGPIKMEFATSLGARLAEIQQQTGAFNHLSDLASLYHGDNCMDWQVMTNSVRAVYNAMNFSAVGKWERDALIVNSVNLFTLRDQTYTILMRADASRDLEKGPALGTAYAIAEIWRDPQPKRDGSGKIMYDGESNLTKRRPLHDIRIQSFRILE